MFIKRGPGRWEYVGTYRFTGSTANRDEIEPHARKADRGKDGYDNVALMVFMKLV